MRSVYWLPDSYFVTRDAGPRRWELLIGMFSHRPYVGHVLSPFTKDRGPSYLMPWSGTNRLMTLPVCASQLNLFIFIYFVFLYLFDFFFFWFLFLYLLYLGCSIKVKQNWDKLAIECTIPVWLFCWSSRACTERRIHINFDKTFLRWGEMGIDFLLKHFFFFTGSYLIRPREVLNRHFAIFAW